MGNVLCDGVFPKAIALPLKFPHLAGASRPAPVGMRSASPARLLAIHPSHRRELVHFLDWADRMDERSSGRV
jgi:hypothetical protein